ncbi:YceI family protein [Alteromonas sp. W364]|uniref:YceI family protein n=1 Tax=Alteromonas sp. W364 TaxID=3075610 RepID=UPI002887C020|nr:YceI family protein [Alteromonas sp. W364]MDT0628683.1 YceI family protein [Alteromonas sp. W364]
MNKLRLTFNNAKIGLIWAVALVFLSLQVNADEPLNVDNSNSTVRFAGEHAGMKFEGIFEKWSAKLVLPPNDAPSIKADFDLRSAKTGDSTYDNTLPEGDWFDVENHPKGKFVSTKIEKKGDNYEVSGDLSLRGLTHPVSFVLISKGDKLEASFDIDRLKYKIGMDSDPDAEWVSQIIKMNMLLNVN